MALAGEMAYRSVNRLLLPKVWLTCKIGRIFVSS
jgi:hypothetical protein